MKPLKIYLFCLSFLCCPFLRAQFVFELHKDHKELGLKETENATFQPDGLLIRPPKNSYYMYVLPFRINQQMKTPKGYELSTTVTSLQDNFKFFGFKIYFQNGHEFSVVYNPRGQYFISYTPSSAANYTTVANWIEIPSINKGANATNKLSVKLDKNSMRFFMNDKSFYKISRSEMENLGMRTNAGIGTIMFYAQGEGEFLVQNVTTSIEPDIVKVKYAPDNLNLRLRPFSDSVNQKEFATVNPVISADENTIFFARKKDFDQAEMISRDKNMLWGDPVEMPFPINRENKHSSIESANSDGTVLYASGVYENGKYFHGLTQYKLNLDGQWVEGQKHRINDLKNVNRFLNFNLSNDGNILLVVADMETGYGNRDIHVSFKQADGSFSMPKNLGRTINSTANEATAFLAPDNVTLYFSTDGLPGYGSNDIFMSKRLDDTWTNWSTPINLGSPINSVGWDSYFTTSASGNMSVIATNFGRSKIGLFYFELEQSVKPDPVIVLSGTVTDAETNLPLITTVLITGLSSKNKSEIITNPNNGRYSKVLLQGEKYEIIAEKEGYYPISELVDLTELKEYAEIEKNLKLVPIKAGQVVRMNNIFFEFAKSVLMSESFEELDRLVNLMMKNPKLHIQISGHTDGVGSVESNLKLSQDRAQSVVDYLVSKGIEPSRLKAVGYGKSMPIATNDTDEGRAINRRVEFLILE
jgi:outer membrane protein OmpA-like peptidoglycan-associated protein